MEIRSIKVKWNTHIVDLEIMSKATWVIDSKEDSDADDLIAVAPFGYDSKDFDCDGWYHYSNGSFDPRQVELEFGFIIRELIELGIRCPVML